ncbi:MAG: glutamate 5-kinase, partial [Selenomonadales bacterium]|nr:glutamate 5-kinase [Selenomonadales bacterium]
ALMHIYEKFFSEYGKVTAQILLTREDSIQHSRFNHSRNALLTLLKMGVIPVINENDAVAVDEIKIGDNDTLSAIVATIVDADTLILLSDIEGLYNANPQTNPNAKKIPLVREITAEIEALAGGPGTKNGTGGMQTKIQAAKIAVSSGIHMLIGSGSKENILHTLLTDENVGTLFVARQSHLQLRKRWLAFGAKLAGTIIVDEGCEHALDTGASLLAAGIVAVDGRFAEGDVIRVLNKNGRELARGRTNYGSEDVSKICGVHTDKIAEILGSKPYDEVIHRDNLVLLAK